jgi:uncharacterized YigZ family protein
MRGAAEPPPAAAADDGYPVPAAQHRAEIVIERSRFIATLAPAPTADAARAFIDAIRAEFPDATHNCWAYVVGPPGTTAAVGMSDAGEPHGTAGRPMLDVLLHSPVGDVAAVVTRYYGGTKLGKGGLVRAYGGAVQHALAELPRALRIERTEHALTVAYGDVEPVRRMLADHGVEVLEETYGADVRYRVAVPAARSGAILAAIVDRTAGRVQVSEPADA